VPGGHLLEVGMKGFGALVALVLVVGCSPGSSESEQPGEEASAVSSPVEEDTSAETGDNGNGGTEPVAVELPGLPIGGNDAQFSSDAPTQCVNVNWTGAGPLPEGAAIQFLAFGVPPEFTVDAEACSDVPCLSGFELTASSGGCDVAVTWNGQALADPDNAFLVATSATLTCVDSATCDEVQSVISETGAAAIGLFVSADEEDDGNGDL